MLTALVRELSPRISECELTYRDRVPIDFERAVSQHAMYEETLKSLGVSVTALPSTPDLPDAVFVEDTAVVLDNAAVIGSPLPSRRAELESVSSILGAHRKLRFITGNGRLEGGDILVVDRTIFAGISSRTNQEGIRQLAGYAEPLGYSVHPTRVTGCLHLKTACTYIGNNTLLANCDWFQVDSVKGQFNIAPVARDEPFAANALLIEPARTLLLPTSASRTATMVKDASEMNVELVDISELEKAEAGLTCCSIIFENKLSSTDS
jgi:dimethylargininase